MGLTFKENIRDIRNSKSFEIIKLLQKKGFIAHAFDKNVDAKDMKNLNFKLVKKIEYNLYDGVIILVAHDYFMKIKDKILKSIKKDGLIFDFKNLLKNKNYQI